MALRERVFSVSHLPSGSSKDIVFASIDTLPTDYEAKKMIKESYGEIPKGDVFVNPCRVTEVDGYMISEGREIDETEFAPT